MTIYWFISFIILVIIELVTINLVTIWFAVGAFSAIIASIFTDSLMWQFIVFLVVSILSLIISKPFLKKMNFDFIPTNFDMLIGDCGIVVKKIIPDKSGEVLIHGKVWTACSQSEIDINKKVKVLKIDGVKLIVEEDL